MHGHRGLDPKSRVWSEWLQSIAISDDRAAFTHGENKRLDGRILFEIQLHLYDEVFAVLVLGRFGGMLDLFQMMKEEGAKVMGGMSQIGVLLIFLFDHDDTFEGGMHIFTPLPCMVEGVLKNVAEKRGSWWHFAACGFDGRPTKLRFVREDQERGCRRLEHLVVRLAAGFVCLQIRLQS